MKWTKAFDESRFGFEIRDENGNHIAFVRKIMGDPEAEKPVDPANEKVSLIDLSNVRISLDPDPKVKTITEDAGRLWSPGKCSTAVIVRTAHDGSPLALAAHALILAAMREAYWWGNDDQYTQREDGAQKALTKYGVSL